MRIRNREILGAFLISFIVHSISIFFSDLFTSAPDELGALSVAAYLAGNDWSSLVSTHGAYYGFGSGWFLAPIFCLTTNPYLIYVVARLLISVYLSLPTIIAYAIMQRYLKIESVALTFWGAIFASFLSNNFADTFTNEALLILLMWVEVYLLIVLDATENKRTKIIITLLLDFVMAYSVTVHTRALMLIALIFFVIIMYRITLKKQITSYLYLVPFFPMFAGAYFANYSCEKLLFIPKDGINLSGAIDTLGSTYVQTIMGTFSNHGWQTSIRGILALISSNTFAIVVFSGGLLIPVTLVSIKLYKNIGVYAKQIPLLIVTTIGILGLYGTICALSLVHIWHGVSIYEQSRVGDGRFFFYLRYYINFLPLFTLPLVYYLDKGYCKHRKCLVQSLLGLAFLQFLFEVFFVVPMKQNSYSAFDIGMLFTAFTPLTHEGQFMFTHYFLIIKLIAILLIFVWFLLKRNWKSMILIIYTVLIIYESFFQQIAFRKPIVDNYDRCLDFTKENLVNNKDFSLLIDKIYVSSNLAYKVECQVQLLFPDKTVLRYNQQKLNDGDILISNNAMQLEDSYEFVADDNEFLYVKDIMIYEYLLKEFEGQSFHSTGGNTF